MTHVNLPEIRKDMISEQQMERRLNLQLHHEWDLFGDIDWARGVDLERDLLPLNDEILMFVEEIGISKRAVSWMFGLLAASAISEHERVLNDLKETWEISISDLARTSGIYQLGQQFFKEELKHSEAYKKFLEASAIFLNLSFHDLKSFLPVYEKDSWLARVYRKDTLAGGNALWWTVAATEEESIELYRMISQNEELIDPLFFRINKLHYEEEIRHSSFSYMMIDLQSRQRPKIVNTSSYLLARSLQFLWIRQQLNRLNGVLKFTQRHPYLADMGRFVTAMNSLPLHKKFRFIFKDSGYISMMLKPENHVRIRRQLSKNCYFPKTGESL